MALETRADVANRAEASTRLANESTDADDRCRGNGVVLSTERVTASRRISIHNAQFRADVSPKQQIHFSAPAKSYYIVKRAYDLLVGVVLLVIAFPLICVAALLIRIETRGSPLFVQTRLGEKGRPFKILKLRGMYADAKDRFASYYDYSNKENLDFFFHQQVDPRITRTGRFLRKTSIDELPNLWNVVMGDMSLVGPRPEIPEVMALYGAYREEYLSVKPGVTCFSKCTGRDKLTKRETIEFDLDYIRQRSFRVDLEILWRTFRGLITRRDVF